MASIRLRRDTAANWTSVNPTLALGEMGVETDTRRAKIGDGSTAWASLAYSPDAYTVAAADAAIAAAVAVAVPSGVMMPYGGAAAPTGWLLCNGAAVSRTTYAALFAAIGVAFGPGDGSTTFNLPDGRDRVAIGAGSTYALAATGGAAAGTPAGTVAAPVFTGTLASLVHTGTAVGNHTFTQPTISWPASVPTIGAYTPAGTVAAPVISWPLATPTFTGSAMATHQHELPFIKVAGGTGQVSFLAPSVFGTGTSRAPESISAAPTANSTSRAVELSQAVSAGTPAGTVAYPVGSVPGATAPAFTGTAWTPPDIAWPVGVPTAAGGAVDAHTVTQPNAHAYTPAGTNNAPAFTGTSMATIPPYLALNWIIKT